MDQDKIKKAWYNAIEEKIEDIIISKEEIDQFVADLEKELKKLNKQAKEILHDYTLDSIKNLHMYEKQVLIAQQESKIANRRSSKMKQKQNINPQATQQRNIFQPMNLMFNFNQHMNPVLNMNPQTPPPKNIIQPINPLINFNLQMNLVLNINPQITPPRNFNQTMNPLINFNQQMNPVLNINQQTTPPRNFNQTMNQFYFHHHS